MTSKSTRRDILLAGAWTMLGGGVVLVGRLVGAAIESRPASTRHLVHVGPIAAIPVGGKLSADGVILIRDERGLAAVSSRCTHLGCTVTSNARGFECNCHGSAFSQDGRVIQGPATAPLPWYQVVLGEDGELRVDLDTEVSPSERLSPEADS